ncbi:hypothetical protein GCM10025882_10340 [Acinetobacter gyllenbergii]|uniref:Uroporphyrin-III C-methyltransferase n=1 Tax=Acinetobacter gyllenbergii CIP 110306 = MTCC 11365 TaxID=1217657 RepID=A0A829HBH0_9GAMM|nr:DUF488 family protein [Acinetobacter gyllenbergii]EPF69310.1 hypothetical protein F957_04191 [Acinetobacter gyllenbergii CIP 110306 = MTCC 11365]EPH33742.1 Hypothetical protein L293_4021 [Acinetobacter gyllenbergii CIP 110306 = MTCC 11365]OBY73326.1 uroporphyrin-III methyltransferase [Acinetobacter gyllenbergii]GMA10610.1 hypothetical protein GCM10025882_10340 [Acinetobacter gyllenbergii]
MQIEIKRIYDPVAVSDGKRILVDRLWPRGVSKERAHLDLWLKEIAPSTALRQAFCHKAEHWLSFQQGYYQELKENPYVQQLREMAAQQQLTLIYAAKDPQLNHALVLKNYLLGIEIQA